MRVVGRHLKKPWFAWAMLGVICALYVIRITGSGRAVTELSHTVDEPYHIGAAVALYEARGHVLGVQHPPLPRLVAGLPLVMMGAELPDYRGTSMSRKEDAAYAAGAEVLYSDGGRNYWRYLAAARWAMLVFPVVALVYVYLLGKWLAGPGAGLAGAVLFSLDTTLLGHGMWVCTDAPAATGFLAAVYHGARFIALPTWGRAVGAGVAAGLGVACKFSVALAGPGLLGVMLVYGVWSWRGSGAMPSGWPKWRGMTLRTAAVFAVAMAVLWGVYFFQIGRLGNSDTLASAPQWDRLPTWVKQTPVPMPAFWIGLGRLAAHSAQGHATYLLGETSAHGVWYYFPVLILTKTPLSLLLAMGAGMVMLLLPINSGTRPETPLSAPPGFLGLVCLIPATVFLAASMFGGIQIGIRHILPALPLIYLLAGAALTRTKGMVVLLGVICLTAAVETRRIHPDYLAYFNSLVKNPRYVATDSNLDWGQDLARLARSPWAGELKAVYPLGDRTEGLFEALGLRRELKDAAIPEEAGSSWVVAVSVTRMVLGPGDSSDLKDIEPIAQVGQGILIYRLPAR